MPRMKHLLRKLHIGGGGGGGLEHQHQTHHRLAETRLNTPPPPLTSPPVLSPSPSQASNSVSPTRDGPDSRGSGSRGEGASTTGGGGGSDFSLLEEEYQVQLALAISASDPNGIDDLDSVQIKAAKQLSLESVATAAGGGSGSSGSSECTMEFLSLRYWGYNVINYDEKLADGFYDVYGIISNPDQKMPSLVDLQSISISDTVDYEVALVNRVVDSALQQLERRALQIALECRATESGLVASGLIQKIAHLVAENMGGPVEDAEEMLRRWTVRSHELRTSLNTIVFPLGLLGVGLSRHRALLFKVLADRVDLPCKLVKGSYYTGTDDGAINLIKVDYGSEYIIDLMGAPGTLIPAEVPSSHLENSGAILHSSDTIEQSVKDLCLALDKVSFQLEDKIEGSAVSSSDKLVSRTVHLPLQEKSHQLCKVGYLRVDGNFPADGAEKEVEMLSQTAGGIQRETLGFIGDISPAEQMKVNNVSKYVVTAAKNPEFAQKLHAVLLESGASPPLDLFSSLNTVHEAVDQKISMYNMNVGRKNSGLSGPSLISTMEADLSNSRYNEDVLRKDVEEMTGKQEQDSSLVANPAVSGNTSILRTNQGINLDTTESVGYPATEAAQKFDSKGTNNFDQLMSSGSLNESFNSLVVSVAEWEIPWEDLQIGERIGLGSYGEVYRADWNGTDVAVKKFLDQDLSGDALDLFRSEVKIMLRLRHPNVVLFMGAVTRPPNLSILTEFLPRGSLYRLLHRPNVKLDERRRLKMALDVAKGMNYLHASHPTIVHRDLKSPNLLVDRNWVVKVCDFGLSRLKHHTFLSSKSTAGTPEWMAPEVLRNEPSNEKCDIYSFGVILWELATLRMPWSGMNPMQVVGAVGYQNKRLEIPQEIDPMVAKIITDCWESDPSQRPSFAQLLPPLKQLHRLVVPIS